MPSKPEPESTNKSLKLDYMKTENRDKIRDLRHKGKFIIDDIYLDKYARLCGVHATGVYSSLCRHANKQQTCFPSKKLIAQELKISERKVYDGLKILKSWNIINIESQGRKNNGSYKSNLYTLLDMSLWHNIPSADSAISTDDALPSASNADHHRYDLPNKETQEEGNTLKETQVDSIELNPFDSFWLEYPKKEQRKLAEEIWKKKKLDQKLSIIIDFIIKAKNTPRWKSGFINQPVKFLKGELWNDDLFGYGEIKQNKLGNILPAPENKYENYR